MSDGLNNQFRIKGRQCDERDCVLCDLENADDRAKLLTLQSHAGVEINRDGEWRQSNPEEFERLRRRAKVKEDVRSAAKKRERDSPGGMRAAMEQFGCAPPQAITLTVGSFKLEYDMPLSGWDISGDPFRIACYYAERFPGNVCKVVRAANKSRGIARKTVRIAVEKLDVDPAIDVA
jgi:hypothetical protein